MREWGKKPPVELLPSPPPSHLRMETSPSTEAAKADRDWLSPSVHESHQARAAAKLLSIKGAANENENQAEAKRRILLERLAKLKSEPKPPSMPTSLTEGPDSSTAEVVKGRGMKSIVRARIQLKLKLESEKATFRHNVNESKAQELRRRLLDAKARREAEETDLTLKRLDMIDRKRELRRRLMVVKMMAAETESERRARELKERLLERKRSGPVPVAAAPAAVVA